MVRNEEIKIAIKIDDELMNLVQDILNGKMLVVDDKTTACQLAYHLHPLRKEGKLTIARDDVTKHTIVFMNGKPKKKKKPRVFGGYLFELIFPTK